MMVVAQRFWGSVNESLAAWTLNYELLWEDKSGEAADWVQEEFDAPLEASRCCRPSRLRYRRHRENPADDKSLTPSISYNQRAKIGTRFLIPAPALIESPVYRKQGLVFGNTKNISLK